MLSEWKDGCCTYLEDALYDDVFIYIVEFLGQFHVNAEIFLLLERTLLLLCYIK